MGILPSVIAQDTSKTVKHYLKKGFAISGGLNLGGELYGVQGITNRRSPYAYSANGRIVFRYKGFSLPMSLTYQDAQFSYAYNFNRLNLTPTYKWIKLHLGWSHMRFSPYTFAGKSFYGAGLELTPGKFQISVLKGRLQNPLAIRDSLVVGATLIPIYDRDIIATKIGYRSGYNKVEFMATQTQDDASSFEMPSEYLQYGYQVLTPKDNITLGFNFGLRLFKHIELYANTAASIFTQDSQDKNLTPFTTSIPSQIVDLQTINTSSKLSFAGDGGINVFLKGHRLGLKYRRIEPFYSTLSTNFLMSDVEQYTFNGSTRLAKSKIKLSANIGLERNNLNNYRSFTNNRVIVNGNVILIPNKSWTTNLRFGNYQSESQAQILDLNDTLRFVSVNTSYSAFSTYTIKQKRSIITINANAYYNTVQDQSEVQLVGDVKILSVSLAPAYGLKEKGLTLGPTITYHKYLYDDITQERFVFGGRVSKTMMDGKLMTSINGNISFNDYNSGSDGKVGYGGLQSSYKLTKQNTISFIATYRKSSSLIANSFSEWRTLIRYGITF